MSKKPSVLITGASSGIGTQLAREFAKKGYVLGIAARRVERLKQLANELAAQTTVHIFELDVSDTKACVDAASLFVKKVGHIDTVIANAGVGSWSDPVEANVFEWAQMVDINLKGVINTLVPFIRPMAEQKSGHLIAVSSIAGLRALPGGPYSATKIAVKYFMDGLRVDLQQYGINVTTLCPGFVETEMLAGEKDFPFLISVEEAVEQMMAAIEARAETHVLPWQWRSAQPLLQMMPNVLFNKLIKRITKQKT